MKIITCARENKGFFANVLDALRHIRKCEETGESFHIQWGPECLYYDSSEGLNAWEYFYKQPCLIETDPNAESVHGYIEIPEKGNSFRLTMNRLINEYLRYSDEAKEIILGKFIDNWPSNKKVLGIHVRFTDKYRWNMFGEPSSAKPLSIETYLVAAEKTLNERNLDWIYLASDNNEAVNAFNKKFGSRLMYINCTRSTGIEGIHNGMQHISGKKKGLGVMTDVQALSMCDFLIRSTSNVGSFAQFLNIDLEHTNLNEIILGDTREQEYGLKSA